MVTARRLAFCRTAGIPALFAVKSLPDIVTVLGALGTLRKGISVEGTIHNDWCLVIDLNVFHALFHMRTYHGVTPVSDKKTRFTRSRASPP